MATNQKELSGIVGFYNDPHALKAAMVKLRQANYQDFDAFTPYPIHGMDGAQGLKKSWIPFATLGAGMCGLTCAFLLQWWTSARDWPLIVGGKPFNSLPAFIPIMFELTVLFAGLTTVGAMFFANGLPNLKRKSFDASITSDRFALFIGAPGTVGPDIHGHIDDEKVAKVLKETSKYKRFEESEAQNFLKSIGAQEVRSVYTEGWF